MQLTTFCFFLFAISSSLSSGIKKIYITSVGQTTNENTKWSDINSWYKKEQKRYAKAVKDGIVKQGENKISSLSPKNESIEAPTPKDGDVTCNPGSSSNKQDEGSSNDVSQQSRKESSNDDHQEDYFDPGPIPQNLYDRGLKENWLEVFFPLSKRKDALSLGGYSRPPPPPNRRSPKQPQQKQRPTTGGRRKGPAKASQQNRHQQPPPQKEDKDITATPLPAAAAAAAAATTTSNKTKST